MSFSNGWEKDLVSPTHMILSIFSILDLWYSFETRSLFKYSFIYVLTSVVESDFSLIVMITSLVISFIS